jgi:hypothetical protein
MGAGCCCHEDPSPRETDALLAEVSRSLGKLAPPEYTDREPPRQNEMLNHDAMMSDMRRDVAIRTAGMYSVRDLSEMEREMNGVFSPAFVAAFLAPKRRPESAVYVKLCQVFDTSEFNRLVRSKEVTDHEALINECMSQARALVAECEVDEVD